MSNSKIKFAIVGFGNIGKRHAYHISQNNEAELVAICDIDEAKKTENFPFYDSIEKMLKEVECDVVNICTPNYLHESHTIQCLQNNKHVVCEKPMATSTSACKNMITASEKYEKTIFVVKQNRYNEPVVQVKQVLDKNILGKIAFVNINCFWNRNENYYKQSSWRGTQQKDGGCLYTQFSHFVDILYFLLGKCKTIHSTFSNSLHDYTEVEDNGACILKTNEGTIVSFNFSTCSYEKNMEGSITIIAENGTIKIGGQYLNTIEYQNIKDTTLPMINITAKANDYGSYSGSMSNHDLVIKNVIDTLHGKDKVKTNAYEGRDVVEIIESMYSRHT